LLKGSSIVPLFNSDKTSINELIMENKPIRLDDLERHFNKDYETTLTKDYEYSESNLDLDYSDNYDNYENFTVFERFFDLDNSTNYLMPQKLEENNNVRRVALPGNS